MLIACEPTSYIVVEPTYKRTFSPVHKLVEGDEIRVVVEHLEPGERLEFYKCGEPCNTATNAGSCGTQDLIDTNEITFRANEGGKYYFWFNDLSENTAVPVNEEIVANDTHTIISESGSKIVIYPVVSLTSLGKGTH